MVDIQSTINAVLPEVKVYGSWLVSTIAWIVLIIFFIIVFSVVIFLVYNYRIYRNKIVIFERINGEWIDTDKDRAREIKFGDLGFTILYCKKFKKYLPIPLHQTGKRKFYYKKRGDGNFENFKLTDPTDNSSSTLAMYSVEKNITERNVGIRKGLEERLNKQNWLKENAIMLISIGFICVIGIFGWLYLDKWIELVNATGGNFNALLERFDTILAKLDSLIQQVNNLQTGGSGYVPAIP